MFFFIPAQVTEDGENPSRTRRCNRQTMDQTLIEKSNREVSIIRRTGSQKTT